MYTLEHFGYCGMRTIHRTYSDESEAREAAADLLRKFRRKFDTQTITKGSQWEILEPADSVMVPDMCGCLYLTAETWQCKECGCEYANQDAAMQCCAYEPDDYDDR